MLFTRDYWVCKIIGILLTFTSLYKQLFSTLKIFLHFSHLIVKHSQLLLHFSLNCLANAWHSTFCLSLRIKDNIETRFKMYNYFTNYLFDSFSYHIGNGILLIQIYVCRCNANCSRAVVLHTDSKLNAEFLWRLFVQWFSIFLLIHYLLLFTFFFASTDGVTVCVCVCVTLLSRMNPLSILEWQALAEWEWQWKIEVVEVQPVPLPLCVP